MSLHDDFRLLCDDVDVDGDEYVDDTDVIDETRERVRTSEGGEGVNGLSSGSKGELDGDE